MYTGTVTKLMDNLKACALDVSTFGTYQLDASIKKKQTKCKSLTLLPTSLMIGLAGFETYLEFSRPKQL
jgi:hypothetical protein